MANIVSPPDFVYEIALPQSEDLVKTRKICSFINNYEAEFRLFALGNAVNEAFEAGITANTQKWIDLRDGVVYEVDGKSIKYGGIKQLIRQYVYYHYMRNEVSTTTHTGEKKEAAANSADFNLHKAVQQWNVMSRDIQKMWDFLYDRVDDDGEKVYSEFETCEINTENFRPINLLGI